MSYVERTLVQTMLKNTQKSRGTRSRGCLLVPRQNESPGKNRRPHQPRVFVCGVARGAKNIRPTKNPPVAQSGPILRKQQLTKRICCGFSARKHPTPPGTGTEPGSSSGLGAAPPPGTRRFSRIVLAVGPPVRTDPRETRIFKSQFFWVEFLRDPLNLAMALGTLDLQTDRHTVPVGTRPTETPLLFPSDGHTNR